MSLSQKLSILLVEDDPTLQWCTKTILENMGCHVTEASSRFEALKKFTPQIDGVLTDIGLPDGDGFDVIHHIHQKYPDYSSVIYVYTAFDRNDIEAQFLKAKAHGFISKPFLQEDIKSFVVAVQNKKQNVAL